MEIYQATEMTRSWQAPSSPFYKLHYKSKQQRKCFASSYSALPRRVRLAQPEWLPTNSQSRTFFYFLYTRFHWRQNLGLKEWLEEDTHRSTPIPLAPFSPASHQLIHRLRKRFFSCPVLHVNCTLGSNCIPWVYNYFLFWQLQSSADKFSLIKFVSTWSRSTWNKWSQFEAKISQRLPKTFALVLVVWRHISTQYLRVSATFQQSRTMLGKMNTTLRFLPSVWWTMRLMSALSNMSSDWTWHYLFSKYIVPTWWSWFVTVLVRFTREMHHSTAVQQNRCKHPTHGPETGSMYPSSVPVEAVTREGGSAGQKTALRRTDTLALSKAADAQVADSPWMCGW